MKKIIFSLAPALLLGIIFLVYKAWFSAELVTSGDFWPYFESMYGNKPLSLYAWDWSQGNGLGGYTSPLLWIYLNFGIALTVFGKLFGLSWPVVERVFYLYPFLLLSIFTSFFLCKLLSKNIVLSIVSAVIYTCNTYILMVVGGGQVAGPGLAYAVSPLVMYGFITLCNSIRANVSKQELLFRVLLITAILSVQMLFDIRFTYVTLGAVLLYWLVISLQYHRKQFVLTSLLGLILPLALVMLVHAFWILPGIATREIPLDQLHTSQVSENAVSYFSFATFENSISLLHPYWPENIFGKVTFMDASFLLLPLLAYSSLLFLKKKDHQAQYVIYFALLGIVGAFLGKGANDPFGQVYIWLFDTVPGFVLFRDPTKWYTLVALSYAFLIPYTINQTYQFLKKHNLKASAHNNSFINSSSIFLIGISFLLLFLIRPALTGQLQGMFQTTSVPTEYMQLEEYLLRQTRFSRTLWVPAVQRFGFMNQNHPAISGSDFFRIYEPDKLVIELAKPESLTLLQNASVKYVILPYDSQKEMYVTDRKFDERKYTALKGALDQVSWLTITQSFGKIIVYEVPKPKAHFSLSENTGQVTYTYNNPTNYIVRFSGVKDGELLIFSEAFDPNWKLEIDGELIGPKRYQTRFTSFSLSKNGDYTGMVSYTPQKWVSKGIIVSRICVLLLVGSLIIVSIRRRNDGD